MAIDSQEDGVGNGGSLSILFNAVLSPTVDFNVNRFGQGDPRTGIATISGYGYFYDYGTCDEAPHPWAVDIVPQSGKAGGKSMTVTFGYACGPFSCANGYVQQTVQLRGGPSM